MKELYIKNLSIEITRRCNMSCAHCMRGDAEHVDIPLKHISTLLRHVRHIQHFNITGGEPSLNVRAIRHILNRVRAYGITVNNFYIVTNGSAASRSSEFIEACAALYEYQEEKEQGAYSGHMLEMSDDRFHDTTEHAATIAALSPYPFFGVRACCSFPGRPQHGGDSESCSQDLSHRRELRLWGPLSQCRGHDPLKWGPELCPPARICPLSLRKTHAIPPENSRRA